MTAVYAEPQPIDLARDRIAARIGSQYPQWRVWHHAPTGMFYAMRRGDFWERQEPGASLHSVHAATPTGLRTLLAIEHQKEVLR
jgi:hypothetical protein